MLEREQSARLQTFRQDEKRFRHYSKVRAAGSSRTWHSKQRDQIAELRRNILVCLQIHTEDIGRHDDEIAKLLARTKNLQRDLDYGPLANDGYAGRMYEYYVRKSVNKRHDETDVEITIPRKEAKNADGAPRDHSRGVSRDRGNYDPRNPLERTQQGDDPDVARGRRWDRSVGRRSVRLRYNRSQRHLEGHPLTQAELDDLDRRRSPIRSRSIDRDEIIIRRRSREGETTKAHNDLNPGELDRSRIIVDVHKHEGNRPAVSKDVNAESNGANVGEARQRRSRSR